MFWTGKAVRDEGPATRVSTDVALLRKDFSLSIDSPFGALTMMYRAMGAYRAFLNGKAIAPQTLLNPGFTDFNKRVLYQTYDVTPMLRKAGRTRLQAMLAAGWAWITAAVVWHSLLRAARHDARATGHHLRGRLA